MRALITNDDGVDSAGIALLARVALDAGLDVVVAAPHEERSGASASLTGMGVDDHLGIGRTEIEGLRGVEVYAVQASPALIAFVATRGAFGDPPDVGRLVAGPAAGDDGYSLFAFGGVVKQKPHEALVVPLRARVRGDKAAEGLPHEVVGGVTK